jgi:nucleotide-binding universal stress UspA family protein
LATTSRHRSGSKVTERAASSSSARTHDGDPLVTFGPGQIASRATPSTFMTLQSIVVALDTPSPKVDLGPVCELAKATGWKVHLLHAAAPEPAFVGHAETNETYDEFRHDQELSDEFTQLAEQAAIFAAHGVDAEAHVIVGPVVEVIIDNATAWDAQMIVAVGHKHRVEQRVVLGSVASTLLKLSPLPVLVLPAPEIADRRAADQRAADPGATGQQVGFTAAVDRLVELLERDPAPDLEPLREAAEAQQETSENTDEATSAASRLRDVIHRFETDHPSITQAVNDVAYYLSAMGI